MGRKLTWLFMIAVVIALVVGCAAPQQQFRTDVKYHDGWSVEEVATLETFQLCNIWILYGQSHVWPVKKVYQELLRRVPETRDPQNLYKACIYRVHAENPTP